VTDVGTAVTAPELTSVKLALREKMCNLNDQMIYI
jgi:hypothetical protein